MKKKYETEEQNKQQKISKIVDLEVDSMSVEDLRANLKFLYKEDYQDYTDNKLNILYERLTKEKSNLVGKPISTKDE
jgi:hypothetical protein